MPASRRAIEVERVDALEVLDAVRNRHARQPLMRSSARRTAASPIACTVTAIPCAGREPHGLARLASSPVMRHAPIAASFVGLEHPRGAAAEAAVEEQLDAADA